MLPSLLFQRRSFVPSIALLLSLLMSANVRAQPLADHVPGDALLYVGWTGYEAKSPGFEGSHFQAILEAAEFKKLMNETLPAVLEKIARENSDADEFLTIARPILTPMLRHRTAIFVSRPVMAKDQQPMPKAGILCQAGPDADALHAHIQKLLADGPQDLQQFVKVSKQGDLVAVTVGYEQGLPAGGGLTATPGFRSIEAHTVRNSSVMMYVDIEALVATVDEGIALYSQDEELNKLWPKIRDVIGLKSAKRFVWSSGFDGKEWMDRVFLLAPEPRTGLLALADPTLVSDAALRSIPSTATLAGASKFDIAKLVAALKKAIVEVEPQAAGDIDRAFAEASKAIGMDVEKDLLAAVGDEWVYYVDPMTGGRGLGGIVILNRLKDAARAEAAFTKLEALVNDELKKNIRDENVEIRFRTTKSGATTIHYLGTPLVSPAWAIKDGHLMIALFPQMVAGAADQIGAGQSILDNPAYQALRKRLGVTQVSEVIFADLPKTAPDSYATWVAISRLVNFADVLGAPAPAMLLPPLNKIMPHLTPAGSVTWVDKDGVHIKAISSFPGATILASDPLGGIQMAAPLMMGVALPAMNRAREQANSIKSANNLRQIAIGAILFANENTKGNYPDTLAQLAEHSDFHPSVFVSPYSSIAVPKEPFANAKDLGKWAGENSDYVWVGKGVRTTAGPDTIIAYEKFGLRPDGKVNVAFADGHIELLNEFELRERLEKGKP